MVLGGVRDPGFGHRLMGLRLAGLHPVVRERAELALDVGDQFGVRAEVSSGFRSLAEQGRLRRRFEGCVRRGVFPSRGCRFPANRPGDSAHNFGLAFDSTIEPRQQANWNLLRRLVGFRVPPNDLVHAEVPGWRQLLA